MFDIEGLINNWHIALVILVLVVGLALVIKGGDVFVESASWFSEAFGIPKLIVGATVVSVATTLPELLVSLFAAIEGSANMAIGNAVGSVSANIGLIFGLSLIAMPGLVSRKSFALKALLMIFACAVLFTFGLTGLLTWYACVILLLTFAVFIFFNVKDAKREMLKGKDEPKPEKTKKLVTINLIKFIVGTVAIAIGANVLVDSSTVIAHRANISDAIIGATILAVGTSLPELITAITAIVKKQGLLSVGNIIGANIIDLAVILPICALVGGGTLAFGSQSSYLDLPVCLGLLCIAVIPTLFSQKLSRWQGVLLVTVYLAYIIIMCLGVIPF